jgi:hypothetical protein
MKKLKGFLNTMAVLTSGMIASTFWITKSDDWHIYLPICLMCIVLGRFLDKD